MRPTREQSVAFLSHESVPGAALDRNAQVRVVKGKRAGDTGSLVIRRHRVSPAELVQEWVIRFNKADVDGLASLYAENATNHQVVMEPLRGREAIRRMFRTEFGRAQMTCVVENIFQDGEWAMLEWSDPNGLRGCGFFHVRGGEIVFQRGYFDQLSFFRLQGIPVPESYLGD